MYSREEIVKAASRARTLIKVGRVVPRRQRDPGAPLGFWGLNGVGYSLDRGRVRKGEVCHACLIGSIVVALIEDGDDEVGGGDVRTRVPGIGHAEDAFEEDRAPKPYPFKGGYGPREKAIELLDNIIANGGRYVDGAA